MNTELRNLPAPFHRHSLATLASDQSSKVAIKPTGCRASQEKTDSDGSCCFSAVHNLSMPSCACTLPTEEVVNACSQRNAERNMGCLRWHSSFDPLSGSCSLGSQLHGGTVSLFAAGSCGRVLGILCREDMNLFRRRARQRRPHRLCLSTHLSTNLVIASVCPLSSCRSMRPDPGSSRQSTLCSGACWATTCSRLSPTVASPSTTRSSIRSTTALGLWSVFWALEVVVEQRKRFLHSASRSVSLLHNSLLTRGVPCGLMKGLEQKKLSFTYFTTGLGMRFRQRGLYNTIQLTFPSLHSVTIRIRRIILYTYYTSIIRVFWNWPGIGPKIR